MTATSLDFQATPGGHAVRFTREQYYVLLDMGFIQENAPYELLEGEIVRKDRSARGSDSTTIYPPHAICVGKFARLIEYVTIHGGHVRTQVPLDLGLDSEPEPDGAIVRGALENYAGAHPQAGDALCVLEASESSLALDRGRKLRIYARANIAQYVIINLVDHVVEVYDQPKPESGIYALMRTVTAGESLGLRMPDGQLVEVEADELLP